MTFLTKKPFFLIFVLCFSAALIVLGMIQSTLGTMRLYNASEQTYEELAANKTYTTDATTQTTPPTVAPNDVSEDTLQYIRENRQAIENAIKAMPPEKAQIAVARIQAIENAFQKKETVQTEEKSQTLSTSPVEISIIPEKTVAPKGYRETLWMVVTGTYFRDALWKFPIFIDTDRAEPRGQMYNESITLSSKILSLTEVGKVLVHEIGHMIDIYTLKKKLQTADPSEEFYTISWVKPNVMKAGLSGASFVSGYASTNQYEDFAESFTMYIFHNQEFLKRSKTNIIIQKKYNFLRTRIFGDAFLGSEYEKEVIPAKVWDVTKIGIRSTSLEAIFAWVRNKTNYAS